jgi:hypothetical protein
MTTVGHYRRYRAVENRGPTFAYADASRGKSRQVVLDLKGSNREVARPTFASRPKPLHSVCGFLPYSKLCERLREAKNVIRFLKPEFIDEIADFYDPADEVD